MPPPKVTDKITSIRGNLTEKLILGFLPLVFTGWTAVSMYERFQQIVAHPDLNGDGRFSILDVPSAAASILLEVGNRYQALLARSKIGLFLEMRSDDPNVFWSVVLAAFTYFVMFAGWWCFFDLDHRRRERAAQK